MPTDVLIVGAGPVGLTLASELTRFGLTVRIVDKTPERTDKSKALIVWPRTLEHLQRAGLAEKFEAVGRPATRARIFHVAKPIGHIKIDDVVTPFPFALRIPQSETERVLEEHLATQGVLVERSVELTALSQNADSTTATLQHADTRTETVTAHWLIGCDGGHSTVRHALNFAFDGDTLPSDWILADVHLRGNIDPGDIELHLHADGILGLFPIPPDRFRIIASYSSRVTTRAPGSTARPDPTLTEIQQLLDQRSARGLQAVNPVWLSSFHINERKVADFRHGRIFLAGDAAHVHSPAGGQGMNTGMQDAFNLAWKLALVVRGRVSTAAAESLLSSYTAERGPIAAAVLRDSGRLTRFATLDNALLRGLRNHLLHFITGFEFVQRAVAKNITEIAIAYPSSPLHARNAGVHKPSIGERAPIRPEEPPVGAGSTPRFALFSAPSEAATQLLAQYPDLLEPTPRAPFHPDGLWLVRPDGYVALAAKSGEWKDVSSFLDRLTVPSMQKTVIAP